MEGFLARRLAAVEGFSTLKVLPVVVVAVVVVVEVVTASSSAGRMAFFGRRPLRFFSPGCGGLVDSLSEDVEYPDDSGSENEDAWVVLK